MRKLFYLLFAFIIVSIVALVYTNPDDSLLKERAGTYVKNELENTVGDFKYRLVEKMAELAAEKAIKIENFVIYKKVSFTLTGYNKTIGYGYLNDFHPSKK